MQRPHRAERRAEAGAGERAGVAVGQGHDAGGGGGLELIMHTALEASSGKTEYPQRKLSSGH